MQSFTRFVAISGMPDDLDEDAIQADLDAGQSFTDVGEDRPVVKTLGADVVYIYVNDGAGGEPADYELRQEVADIDPRKDPTWDPHDIIPPTETQNAVSWLDDPVPWAMRVDVVNRSGGPATFRVRVVSIDPEGGS